MEKIKDENGNIIYKIKNSYGQFLNLKFEYIPYDKFIDWNVVFYIGKRKQGYQYLKQTGKDGIKSLLWAKKCIIEFIDMLQKNYIYNNKTNNICIGWDDKRRKEIYTWGLRDLEFKLTRIGKSMFLCKKIKF